MFDPALSLKRAVADKLEELGPFPGATERGSHKMNVSPLDLRQQRFRTVMRGFDKIEVTSFLAAVADDYEQALRETDKLRQDLTRMEGVLSEHREHEKSLRNTLLTAQRLSDEIRNNATDEATRILREAEGRANLLLERAQARLEDIQREIDGLRLKRKDVETSIESTIQTLRNTLDYVREQDVRDQDDKILLHRPRHSDADVRDDDGRDELEPARKIVG